MSSRTSLEHRQIVIPGDRKLGFAEYGDPAGKPVLYFHGFPGSRLEASLLDSAGRELGARLIAMDRPGYGMSDALPGRRLTDWPLDVAALIHLLGIHRFAVLGVSGGGPYALACGAALASRVASISIVGGIGPLCTPGAAADMPRRRWAACAVLRRFPWMITPAYAFLTRRILGNPEGVLEYLRSQCGERDRETLQQPEFRALLTRGFQEAVRNGRGGGTADLRIYLSPWDLDLGRITAPATLWHGEMDRSVPVEMSRRLAVELPRAVLRLFREEGHYSLPVVHGRDILAEALATAEF